MSVGRVLLAVTVLVMARVAPAADATQPVEQVWEGTLKVSPAAQLRLVFRVKEGPEGKLSAAMDSPDQGARDIPVDEVMRDRSRLSFVLKTLGAKYDGKFDEDGTEAVGTFTQSGQTFPLTLTKSDAPPAGANPPGNEQVWEGRLSVSPVVSLRLVLHVFKGRDGVLTATFDSPDQGARGLEVDSVTLDEAKFSFEMKSIGARFEGKLGGDEATGTWTQGGSSLPLTLKKVDRPTEVRRPQTPKPPFPYRAEEVIYGLSGLDRPVPTASPRHRASVDRDRVPG